MTVFCVERGVGGRREEEEEVVVVVEEVMVLELEDLGGWGGRGVGVWRNEGMGI